MEIQSRFLILAVILGLGHASDPAIVSAQEVATAEGGKKRTSEVKAELLSQIPELSVGRSFQARDTLNCGEETLDDARDCLAGLVWEPGEFQVTLQDGNKEQGNERMVRFPSPKPLGNEVNDLVAMEWHIARDESGKPMKAPAVVVVHESGSGMTVGRLIARGLVAHKLHTFMLQMPSYGVRRSNDQRDAASFLPSLKQAIADVRRARDAVASLPLVDERLVGVQGTSLGGFVTASVSGLDSGYQRQFVLLAGGNLHEVIFNGQKDAAKVRQRLEQAGATREQIIEHARQIEPLRLAHRVAADDTWLWSGKYDDVVPPASSFAWAKAAKLAADHHIEMPVNHYTGIILMPRILDEIARKMSPQ